MKILHTVALYAPSIGGSQEVVKQLSEHLVAMGHEVTVATSYMPERAMKAMSGVKIVSFKVSGNAVSEMSGEIKKYQNFVIKGNFDVVLNYAAQSWSTDALIPVLSKIKAKKIFVPCGFSALEDPAYKHYFAKMLSWIKNYEAIVFTSKSYQDYTYIAKPIHKNIHVIENGASEIEFANITQENNLRKKLHIPGDHQLILNVSSHVFSKEHARAMHIFSEANLPNATLLIIANHFENPECRDSCIRNAFIFNYHPYRLIDHKKMLVKELSRKDTLDAYMTANVFLFPSSLECAPLVLYECLAAGLPFIAFPAGNAAEIVQTTGAGFTFTTDHGATELVSKLTNKALARKIGNRGRTYWKKHASWEVITRKYEKLYTQVTSRKISP